MSPTQQALYTRLEAYRFDADGARLSFADRLARDNGWSDLYALRAIAEYKRFMFLVCTAAPGEASTPSDAVDQVWHLHLLYTRAYWEEFCPHVLRQTVHHGPTRGGTAERGRYHDQYAATLARYALFWRKPPGDLWPSPEIRMRATNFRRVDLDRHWLVRKPF